MIIANVFFAEIDASGKATVLLNYTIPKFRDFKVGRYLFRHRIGYLRQKGIKEIVYLKVDNPNHERFLKIIGFNKSPTKDCRYKLTITN